MRIRDWYFQGWERRQDEAGKSVLVYTGETYAFPGGKKSAQAPALLLAAALIAAYLVVALSPSEGGMWHYAAIPQLLEVIPLIYLAMGAVRLARAKEPMPYRDWYASWRRMRFAALWSAVFTACMAAVELAYILLAGPSLPPELLYLLGEAACLSLSLALYLFITKRPCTPSVQTEKE